ncbi:MAG: NADP-dependent malic enzyme [Chloroflexi bacterium]|nr:NADP-dependent malic enzyme [Chloroflexota bacterium]
MDYGKMAIEMHLKSRGKISMASKVPLTSALDMSLAYTPGVAQVSLEVAKDKEKAYLMTNKGNMVAVVSDGSAVLGLGNIGPEGAMPVMEGKAVLFKELAGIDAWPICLATQDPDEIIMIVRNLAPTFGGINLEDIKAPQCFYIEDSLQDLGIPVFHDDQHGTAVVVLAAVINALKTVGKDFKEIKVVFSGAGASGIACARILQEMGTTNIILVDTRGTIYKGRDNLNAVKEKIAESTNPEMVKGTIHDGIKGADVFIGLSTKGILDADDIRTMNKDAIVIAMANPDPEIMPEEAKKGGAKVVGTGRSDLPNQVNNVLGFPGIFRGALDVRATRVTMGMKIAAGRAIAECIPEPTPEEIIPYALNLAVVPAVAEAVAQAWRAETAP